MRTTDHQAPRPPAEPPENEWTFVHELQQPLHTPWRWTPRTARPDEAALTGGAILRPEFPDPAGLLTTATADFRAFLQCAGVSEGPYRIRTARQSLGQRERYRVVVGARECRIVAGDTEGIRRGLVFVEAQMRRAGGPFLPLGTVTRTPVIRTRLSRCFFGPICRPPKNRDELADDVDYYPDEYLNRLAHDGVNGLWLTVKFRDLCPSRFFPEFGRDAPRRLDKLRRTVARCARYGIKIYPFCIEPMGFGGNPDHLHPMRSLEAQPQFAGHRSHGQVHFCTSTPEAQAYLEEATHFLFAQVPGLGGLIDIVMGERPTNCFSGFAFTTNTCPRCSVREPWEVYRDTLGALTRGMQRASPEAQLFAWFYVPAIWETPGATIKTQVEAIRKIAAHLPQDVVFQYNFESMGRTRQLGRERLVRDYSLAYAGPSRIFAGNARAARQAGAEVSAKLQVGCSHEVATVPCVPAPERLYRKYQAMRRLGVSAAMQCWYFGNYPSLMTRAAGELAFDPLPRSDAAFLRQLAGVTWGPDAAVVARAWKHFSSAYAKFPAGLPFSYYGPVHDATVWPLHLLPVDKPIAPSWQLNWPVSGDRIGECIGFDHRLDEALILTRDMRGEWDQGVRLLEGLATRYAGQREQEREIGLATALGLQFRAADNLLRFYALREALIEGWPRGAARRLEAMRSIVREEIAGTRRLAVLARADSTLGFHSEAEGHKYFPAKLAWRAGLLERLLRRDFARVERARREGRDPFGAYRGTAPDGRPVYACAHWRKGRGLAWDRLPVAECAPSGAGRALRRRPVAWRTTWQAACDGKGLHVRIRCATPTGAPQQPAVPYLLQSEHVHVSIEPRRLWPSYDFHVGPTGVHYQDNKSVKPDPRYTVEVTRDDGGWTARLAIPFACFESSGYNRRSLRINVARVIPGVGTLSWVPLHPLRYRLLFDTANPADYGRILLEERGLRLPGRVERASPA